MGITKDRGYWYFVKRVPKRFSHVDKRIQVRRALWTDSERDARAKAPAVEAEFMAYWEALAAGRKHDAAAAYEAAKRLAIARGFSYRPAVELADASLEELVARLETLTGKDIATGNDIEVSAVLGGAEVPSVSLTAAFEDFCRFAAVDRLAGKSEAQKKRWRKTREWSIKSFVTVCGDLPIAEIKRSDAQKFRDHLAARIEDNNLDRNTANKQIGQLANLFQAWVEYHALELSNPFAKLGFKERSKKTTGVPYSVEFIRDRLLQESALSGLNDEAREVLLVMINTGARPSEVLGGRFMIDDPVPYLDICADGNRELKTETTARKIPLLGVSLDAACRIVDRGGISRYSDNSSSWSAAANKYLQNNGLRETPAHTAYSLRHSFEDRMTEAGVDDRIRAELMGHKYDRPDYGRGGSLEVRRKALEPISFY